MLPDSIIPMKFDTYEKEEWGAYRDRLHLANDKALVQFYRQVVYDHFSHFNDHYPDFNLEQYSFEMIEMTAQAATDSIRFFENRVVDFWAEQYDRFAEINQDYIIFQSMSASKTFPFPPILLNPALINGKHWRECGRPYHLIEGTHRVSYLRHMLEKGLVSPTSVHEFVLVKPIEN